MTEFSLVAGLLTLVVVAVLQLALALHVRNTLLDAAAEGAWYAALAGVGLDAGVERTELLIATALGDGLDVEVEGAFTDFAGHPAIEISVTAPLPLLGLLGPTTLEVQGYAAREVLE